MVRLTEALIHLFHLYPSSCAGSMKRQLQSCTYPVLLPYLIEKKKNQRAKSPF